MGTAELHHLLGQLRRRMGAQGRPQGCLRAGRRLSRRRALLHLVARRFDHRHERGRRGTARQQAAHQSLHRCQRNHRLLFSAAKRSGGKSGVSAHGAAAARRISCSRPSRRFRKCCASRNTARIISSRSPTRAPTPAAFRGATPSEAVSWGKVDPDRLPDAVVCYTDTTIAMPILTHYALARHAKRTLKRLYDQRPQVGQGADQGVFRAQQGEDD